MTTDGHVPLSAFHLIERTAPTVPALGNLDNEISQALSALNLPAESLQAKQIGVAVGSPLMSRDPYRRSPGFA